MLFGDSRLAQFNPSSKSFFYLIVSTPRPPPLIFGVLQVALVIDKGLIGRRWGDADGARVSPGRRLMRPFGERNRNRCFCYGV